MTDQLFKLEGIQFAQNRCISCNVLFNAEGLLIHSVVQNMYFIVEIHLVELIVFGSGKAIAHSSNNRPQLKTSDLN